MLPTTVLTYGLLNENNISSIPNSSALAESQWPSPPQLESCELLPVFLPLIL
jgi:hypothetical protein